MNTYPKAWSLVLAAGEGSRLRSLTTTPAGVAVPKQFCSLQGGPTLLDEALQRARAVAPPAQVCAVVAEQHRTWWQPALSALAPGNVISQPCNRGTAHGILLPLLQIMARDPDALVLLLPADHHVQDEATLMHSLRRATTLAMAYPNSVLLLGVEPEHPDTELGYILPADAGSAGLSRVRRFMEKPRLEVASALLDQGALWNVFIVVATARALLCHARHRGTRPPRRRGRRTGGTLPGPPQRRLLGSRARRPGGATSSPPRSPLRVVRPGHAATGG